MWAKPQGYLVTVLNNEDLRPRVIIPKYHKTSLIKKKLILLKNIYFQKEKAHFSQFTTLKISLFG